MPHGLVPVLYQTLGRLLGSDWVVRCMDVEMRRNAVILSDAATSVLTKTNNRGYPTGHSIRRYCVYCTMIV